MKRHRHIFIVDPKLQWTIVLYSVGVSLLTLLGFSTFNRLYLFAVQAAGPDEAFLPTILKALFVLTGYITLITIAILFSHRLAGPIYRIRQHMKGVIAGGPIRPISFRNYDYFKNLEADYNEFLLTIPEKDPSVKNSESGFTLLELMVVVAIAGIFITLGISTPAMPTHQLTFNQEVDRLEDALISARNKAISQGQCAFVNVSGANEIVVRTYAIAAPCNQAALPGPESEVRVPFDEEYSVSNFNTGSTLIFHPGGGTTETRPALISLESKKGFKAQFMIYQAIGQVRRQ